MAINRRTAIASLAAATVPISAFAHGRAVLIGAARDAGQDVALLLKADGAVAKRFSLPARGHGAAVRRDGGIAVLFARRPGAFAVAFDGIRVWRATTFAPPLGRRFNGHGCFSADGRLLFAAENDFENARGVIGAYEVAAGFRRIGEFDSGGIGPHEIILVRDGRTIVVANGGIETHPDYPRAKLNLAEMRSNITYLNAADGGLIWRAETPASLSRLSLRHIAEARDGAVWAGGQYEGALADRPPMLWVSRYGEKLKPVAASAMPAFRGYIGSVAIDKRGGRIAATSPRGGVLTIWRAADRTLELQRAIDDVGGVARWRGGFIASDGGGRLQTSDAPFQSFSNMRWDNHLAAI